MRSVATNTLPQENVARVQHFFLQRVFLNTFFAPKKSIKKEKKLQKIWSIQKLFVPL